MTDYFGTTPAQNDTADPSVDLTLYDIATFIMTNVGIIAILMLL